ncbi:hypothetical protein [uncultured Finegoldia sp.]|uniref:hypothetical protein n=1 Tax=uncultured Finegoldia sp. TaxID=328009 RepID=UPI00261B24D2|nr:hypothetical protein [uncultured Finegoldia sp.]
MRRLSKIFIMAMVLALFVCVLASCEQKNEDKSSQNETKLSEQQQKLVGDYFEEAFKDIKPGKDRKLTDDEIKQIKKALTENLPGSQFDDIKNITSNFFRAGSYSDVKKMDFESFINYFPGRTIEQNSDEFKEKMGKLKKLDNFSEYESLSNNMPLVEIDKNLVDNTLKKYANIVSDDVETKDRCMYLKDYNAFYMFVSDVCVGTFVPKEGEIKGNNLILKQHSSTLTLEYKDSKFFVKSFTE